MSTAQAINRSEQDLWFQMKEAWDVSTEGFLFVALDGTVQLGNERTRSLLGEILDEKQLAGKIRGRGRKRGEEKSVLPIEAGHHRCRISQADGKSVDIQVEVIGVEAGRWLVLRAAATKQPTNGSTDVNTAVAALAERALRQLQGERQKLSRFLHDTVAQDLVALSFSLSSLRLGQVPSDPSVAAVEQSLKLLERCCRDVRLVSYILAPPLFAEIGFIPALEWYGGQLQREAGMEVELGFDALPNSPSPEVESVLFAVLQAAVARSVRENDRRKKRVLLQYQEPALTLRYEVLTPVGETHDRGIDELLEDFGIMAERLKQLGGALEIENAGERLSIVATVPLEGKRA